jgi:GxxExxY protein
VVLHGVVLGTLRLDMVVEEAIVVENKASKEIGDADVRQILTYLKGSLYEVGLLLHFGPKATHRRFLYTNDRKSSIPSV